MADPVIAIRRDDPTHSGIHGVPSMTFQHYYNEPRLGDHRLPGGVRGRLFHAVKAYGKDHATFMAKDIQDATGGTQEAVCNIIKGMLSNGHLKRVSRGLYRLTGVV